MALSFSASSYPLYVANNVNKHEKKPSVIRSPPSSSFALRSCSPPIKADHSINNSSDPQRICSQENTVGIIGGVSVLSTLIFLEKFVLWSSREERETIPFIVCSDPMVVKDAYKSSIATSSASRESVSDSNDEEISAGLDRVRLVENLREKRVFLEGGGARCIVMPCHLSHAWYGEISQGCEQPFLHVAECVVKELKEARFRPLEVGSCVKVGVLASDATLVAGVYQEKLQDQVFVFFIYTYCIKFMLCANFFYFCGRYCQPNQKSVIHINEINFL